MSSGLSRAVSIDRLHSSHERSWISKTRSSGEALIIT
jgi:hypothetical protein